VLAAVEQNRVKCEADPQDREALLAIRRGFHTLKGSGRMVGLLELGETAYSMEKVLNRWLDEERPASAELLAVVRDAEAGFGRWVSELQSRGTVHVDDSDVMALIARLEVLHPARTEPETATTLETPVAEAADETIEFAPLEEAEAAAPAFSEQILVGDTVISESLYQILLEETAQLLDTVRREHSVLEFEPGARPSEAMVRAAHTLTGIHRTAGFPGRRHRLCARNRAAEFAAPTAAAQSMLPEEGRCSTVARGSVDFIGMRQHFGTGVAGADTAPGAARCIAGDKRRRDRGRDAGGAGAPTRFPAAEPAIPAEPISVRTAIPVRTAGYQRNRHSNLSRGPSSQKRPPYRTSARVAEAAADLPAEPRLAVLPPEK
jgi:HPt (histidine-containing phosphotransfer) domain-containing protein